jgi:hypothetical protein
LPGMCYFLPVSLQNILHGWQSDLPQPIIAYIEGARAPFFVFN